MARPASVAFDASMRVVILRGPDTYLRDAYTRQLVAALEVAFGEVGYFTYDGTTAEPAAVLDELRSFGLLQPHKLVILDQADKFLAGGDDEVAAVAGKGPGRGRPRTRRELLERYAGQPVESATLLLRAETWRPGRLDKAVAKCGAIVKCEAPGDAAALRWVTGRCPAEYDATIGDEAARMLVERIGSDLGRLDVELSKLAAYVGPEGTIGAGEIRTLVGLSREEQAWEIQAALLSGSAGVALGKLRELLQVSRQPEPLIVWAITDLLRKLHAASQLLSRGVPAAAVAAELKLWGPAKAAVLRRAGQLEPARWAQLLRMSIEADMGNKAGLGKPSRTLEALAARIADTLRCAPS